MFLNFETVESEEKAAEMLTGEVDAVLIGGEGEDARLLVRDKEAAQVVLATARVSDLVIPLWDAENSILVLPGVPVEAFRSFVA